VVLNVVKKVFNNTTDISLHYMNFKNFLLAKESDLKGKSHVPYYMDKRGYKKATFHATHEIISG